jgi:hypothetical protein
LLLSGIDESTLRGMVDAAWIAHVRMASSRDEAWKRAKFVWEEHGIFVPLDERDDPDEWEVWKAGVVRYRPGKSRTAHESDERFWRKTFRRYGIAY